MLHFCECIVPLSKVKLANTENSQVYFTLKGKKKKKIQYKATFDK